MSQKGKPTRSVMAIAQVVVPRPGIRPRLTAGFWAIFTVLAAALTVARSATLFDRMWAEDGSEFYDDVLNEHALAIWRPMHGYLHVVPRLVAAPSGLVDVDNAARYFGIATLLCTVAVSCLVVWASGWYLQPLWARVTLGLSVVLLPVLREEALLSIALLHFVLLYALFWLVLVPVGRSWTQGVLVIAILLVTLSTPLGGVYLPLAVVRWLATRARRLLPMLAALAIGSVAQVAVNVAGASDDRWSSTYGGLRALGRGAVDVFGALTPRPHLPSPWDDRLTLGAVIACAFVVLLAIPLGHLFVATVRSASGASPQKRVGAQVAVVSVAQAALVLAGSIVVGGIVPPRYLVAPGLLIVCAVVAGLVAVRADPVSSSDRAGAVVLGALGAVVLVSAALGLSASGFRRSGEPWRAAVAEAADTCAARDVDAVRIDTGVASWATVDVPCGRLR
jgi:hypothetical protein